MKTNGIHIAIIGLLLVYIVFLRECQPTKPTNGKGTVISTDTVRKLVYRDSIVARITYKDTLIHRPTLVDSRPGNNGQLSRINTFADTVKFDSLHIYYRAQTTGALNWIQLGFIDFRPKHYRIIEHKTTITNTVLPTHQLWLGAEAGGSDQSFNNLSVYARYTRHKNEYSYRYNVIQKTHNIGLGVRIFSK